jgi:alpha-1,3-rhamnosyl/mannosyltransferase
VSLVHALDTRLPLAYGGPLVATVYDVISVLPEAERLGWSTSRFREKKERAYRAIAARAAAIVTLSRAVRDGFLERFPTRARVEVIPPGVDRPPRLPSREEAERRLRPLGIEAPFLLSVGALCPRKNLEAVVGAFLAAREAVPGLRLVLVGEEAFGWAGSRGQAAVRAAGPGVIRAGYLDREDLWAAHVLASVLLHLSHHEGFGLPVIEALAAGTPVVASARGGIPEAAGEAGWLVDPDDARAVADTLVHVLAGGGEVDARARAGIAHAGRLTWDLAGERISALQAAVRG